MAKDVDLSSREWLDIVFEGKNKDFGAYELRNESAKRHNKSVIFTLIGIILVAALAWGWSKYNTYMTEKRLAEEKARQEAPTRSFLPPASVRKLSCPRSPAFPPYTIW